MYPSGFFPTMSRSLAVAIHWFLLASAVVFPEALARTSKQYPKDLSQGHKWNAAPKINVTTSKVESALKNHQRVATKENLGGFKRGQRSLLIDSDFFNPAPTYPSPSPTPNPYSVPIFPTDYLNKNVYPDVANAQSSIGSSYPVIGFGQPSTGNNVPGLIGYPGAGSGYPGAGNGYPGAGSGYPGAGNGYPGAGSGYPGAVNGYPSSGTGFPEFSQISPQIKFPISQSPYQGAGNPSDSNWYQSPQNGYQSPIAGTAPFYPNSVNVTSPWNTPFSQLSQYPINPAFDTAAYSQPVNIPNIVSAVYGVQQPNWPQNSPAYPGYSPYSGYDQQAVQGLQPANPQSIQNPQVYGSPGIGSNPLTFNDLLPCQVLCCLLSLCQLFSLPPCTSCETVPGLVQPQTQAFPSSSGDALKSKVMPISGRGMAPSKVVVTPTKEPAPTTKQGDLRSPSSDSQKPSSPEIAPPTATKKPSSEPAKEGSSPSIIRIGRDMVPPAVQVPATVPKTAINVLVPSETPSQASASGQQQPPPPPMSKAIRSLEENVTPPEQSSSTSEKVEPPVVTATRSLI